MSVIETGLKRLQGRGIAGPVSLLDGEENFFNQVKLIHRYGSSALVSLIDEHGMSANILFDDSDEGREERKKHLSEIENRIRIILINNKLSIKSVVFDRD
jgi:cobalamin-dependent methionine synthase I